MFQAHRGTFGRAGVTPLLIAGCTLLGSYAAAACELPPLTAIPEVKGVTAKQQQVLEETQRYHEAMTAYAECTKQQLIAAGGNAAPPLQKALLINRYNAAVAEVQTVLKIFEKNVGKPLTPSERALRDQAAQRQRSDNGGLDSAFIQFPNGGSSMSSGQPRPQ